MGIVLPKPIVSKVVERKGDGHVNSALCSINGYRNNMEDAHIMSIDTARMLFGVFDGHSNASCSAYVAQHLPAKIAALASPIDDSTLEKLCVDLDEEFVSQHNDGGTTATFAIIEPKVVDGETVYSIIVCNVGDSRIILMKPGPGKGKGELKFVTEDHKPMNPSERERIERCGGVVRMNRVDGDLAVSRAFGDAMFKRNNDTLRNQKVVAVPEITRIEAKKGDILLLACDGVFEGAFPTEDVVDYVAYHLPAADDDMAVVAARVVDQAVRRGSKDNITCMVVNFTDGTEAVKKLGEKDFVPGPPFPKSHEASKNAYTHMAADAGYDLPAALRKRYELLQANLSGTLSSLPALQQTAFEMQDAADLDCEKQFFGKGPTPGEEAQFFEDLAKGNNM